MKTQQITTIISSLLIGYTLALPAVAQMYRYVDENGQVTYSQFRPPEGTSSTTVRPPPPPPSTAADSRKALVDSLQKREETKQDQQETKKKQEEKLTEEKRLKQNCEAARKNLANLTAADNRQMVDKDGKALEISKFKRKQMIDQAKAVMKRDCK